MEHAKPNEATEFLWRRLHEECPTWAIGVPVLFAFLVVALVVIFRPEKKLIAALVGGIAVGIIALIYLPLAYLLVKIFTWLVILIPVLGVAMFYVGMMYIRDARSVHWLWAIFLGMLRTTVYMILALVFLLPGCQHFEKQEYESKVIFLIDVSGSMYVIDDLPEPGKKITDLPTRQAKIIKFLTDGDEPFMSKVMAKSPVVVGRFGPMLDETDLVNLHTRKQKSLSVGDWTRWLNPDKKDVSAPNLENLKDEEKKERLALYAKRLETIDTLRSGTNICGSALQMHKLENSSYIQAIVIISDGQTNVGGDDARSDFLNRVNSAKRTIPVITVGVGHFRLPVSIRVDEINAPEETRPDDAFKIKVPVVSTGIPGEKFNVIVEVRRIEDLTGKPIPKEAEKTYTLPIKEGTFKGAGDTQQGIVDFEINVGQLKEIEPAKDLNGLLEGRWQIIARVAKHEKEAIENEFHVSDPVTVQIQKRALRVLLFAGGATREYQFLRTILYREMNEKRMEFCIHNQSNVKEDHIDQDVAPERMLEDFPSRIGPNLPGEQFRSLSDYDVVIAFDPDWSRLSLNQRKLLKDWVDTYGGGLIYVAGPVYSYQLARAGGQDISSLLSLLPVVLKDARLHGIGIPGAGVGHDSTRPYALNFNPAASQYPFIKLDEAGKNPIAGWNAFFYGDDRINPEPGKDLRPKKGFFTYYPVERVKPAGEVIAVFAGPKESRIGDKTEAFKDQQPFWVTMTAGRGKSMYIGSGEFWRLRAFKDGYHERLWIKMTRYVAASAREQKKYGRLTMPRSAPIGRIDVDAELKGKDLQPLGADIVPTILVRKKNRGGDADPKDKDKEKDNDKDKDKEKKDAKVEKKDTNLKFDLKAKPGDGPWMGTFYGSIILSEDGEYEFRLPIPGVDGEYLKQTLVVRKPNPELDNVRTNFGYLYQLASPSDTLLKNLPVDTKRRIEGLLQIPDGQVPVEGEKVAKRLYFPLSKADAIADCIVPIPPKTDTVKGRFEDLWDERLPEDWPLWVLLLLVLAPLPVGMLGAVIFMLLKEWLSALAFFGLTCLLSLLVFVVWLAIGQPVQIFWALLLTPILVGVVGAVILLLLRQWISAPIFFGACVVLSLIGLLFAYQPIVALVLVGVLIGAGTTGYSIYLLIKQEIVSGAILFVSVATAGGIALILYYLYLHVHTENFAKSIREDSLTLGFSILLVVAVSLVGLEWLTRKLLRLA